MPVSQRHTANRRSILQAGGAILAGCAFGIEHAVAQNPTVRPPHIPITKTGQDALGRTRGRLQFAYDDLGLRFGALIYLRIIKDQRRLEVWVQKRGAAYERLRGYRLCGGGANAAARQPEGFYALGPNSLRPRLATYLGIDIGWPNAIDRARGATSGSSLLQAGCAAEPHFGLTDQDLEEVFTIVHGALSRGQMNVPLHIFPFAMGALNMVTRGTGPNSAFWRTLAPAWRQFEQTKRPPQVQISGRRYIVVGS
jgi:murein L,D-transpeptidase YafK